MRRALYCLLLVGCGGDPEPGMVESGTGNWGVMDLPGGPPRVLDLGTSVLRLTGGNTVTFTAVVDDPDGETDALEVTLESDTGVVYGGMESAPAGRFVLLASR